MELNLTAEQVQLLQQVLENQTLHKHQHSKSSN